MTQAPTAGHDDHRGVAVCAVLAVVAVVVGVAAVVADEAVLGARRGGGRRRRRRRRRARRRAPQRAPSDSLLEARAQARRLRRQLAVAPGRGGRASSDGADAAPVDLRRTDTDEWEIDPVSGLLRERHLPVLLQQVVAAARRKVQPVSVVFWELDGLQTAPRDGATTQALTALGAVAWRTLRESDARVPPRRRRRGRRCSSTPPSPARVMVAERVREALRAEPGRRLAHRVGRHRVLPHARARRGRARRPRRSRARAGARGRARARLRRDRRPGGLSYSRVEAAISRAYLAAMPRRFSFIVGRELLGVGQPLVARAR